MSRLDTIVPNLALDGEGSGTGRLVGVPIKPEIKRTIGLIWRKGAFRSAASLALASELLALVSSRGKKRRKINL